ncbi:hypothetical protein RvY_08522 [Ramazzottius varieornatus]|uniref:G-protein coupled receptors family 1 profile domain-containing protein n=1 Tax=Ramazzottius varieornatus TaxID=947166 RepID=A0A1D1V634_RAMVA|nr:hypothetical protein RvY_08522 [Ramazzottius varieornatus]
MLGFLFEVPPHPNFCHSQASSHLVQRLRSLANLGFLLLFCPASKANDFAHHDYPTTSFCFFVRYTNHIFGGTINNSHLLIAVNRFWAVAYRNHHRFNSLKRPALACLAMWIYVHIWLLPGPIIDSTTERTNAEQFHCRSTAQSPRLWLVISLIVVYDIPLLLTFLAYPFILYNALNRTRVRQVPNPNVQTQLVVVGGAAGQLADSFSRFPC